MFLFVAHKILQVERSSGYEIISKTFTESEKCGLMEIEAFKLPMVAVPLRKHSGYRELFGTRCAVATSHKLTTLDLLIASNS